MSIIQSLSSVSKIVQLEETVSKAGLFENPTISVDTSLRIGKPFPVLETIKTIYAIQCQTKIISCILDESERFRNVFNKQKSNGLPDDVKLESFIRKLLYKKNIQNPIFLTGFISGDILTHLNFKEIEKVADVRLCDKILIISGDLPKFTYLTPDDVSNPFTPYWNFSLDKEKTKIYQILLK